MLSHTITKVHKKNLVRRYILSDVEMLRVVGEDSGVTSIPLDEGMMRVLGSIYIYTYARISTYTFKKYYHSHKV